MKKLLGKTNKGYMIYGDDDIDNLPLLIPLETLLLSLDISTDRYEIQSNIQSYEYDIGLLYCIPIVSNDIVYYAIDRNKKQQWYYPYVSKLPQHTNIVSYTYKVAVDQSINLLNLDIGPIVAYHPDDWEHHSYNDVPQESFMQSVEFWKYHALVDTDADISIQKESIIYTCPW